MFFGSRPAAPFYDDFRVRKAKNTLKFLFGSRPAAPGGKAEKVGSAKK